jgi:predicted MPP superfamily phosphohydrolase
MTLPFSKLRYWIAGFVAFGIACLAYAYFIEPNRLVVNESTIYIKNWNPAFDGLRIAMIADIHGGSNNVTEEKIREVVARCNDHNPDVVVLLGDYVSQTSGLKPQDERELKMPVETVARNMAGLLSKYGVFAVLGNHDGWYGDNNVAAALTADGYKVLQNEVAFIQNSDGQRIRIYGMKDHLALTGGWYKTSADARNDLKDTGHDDLIVLEHSPDMLPVISGEFSISPELRLLLAAHTHGGQVWLPILGRPIIPSGYGQKYAYGHIFDRGVDVFVTSGIGTSVLPIRFMVPPEIAVVTIRSK